eukprot:scaffold1648_cov115-Cylindrotheca_fusiformis.AAC.9
MEMEKMKKLEVDIPSNVNMIGITPRESLAFRGLKSPRPQREYRYIEQILGFLVGISKHQFDCALGSG